jgi:hypothetical protein
VLNKIIVDSGLIDDDDFVCAHIKELEREKNVVFNMWTSIFAYSNKEIFVLYQRHESVSDSIFQVTSVNLLAELRKYNIAKLLVNDDF